jgi:hypothetical protein
MLDSGEPVFQVWVVWRFMWRRNLLANLDPFPPYMMECGVGSLFEKPGRSYIYSSGILTGSTVKNIQWSTVA